MSEDLDIIENDLSDNTYLAKVLGVTTRQVSRYRAKKQLPPAGVTKEEVIKHLFHLVENPLGKQELDELKTQEQIKKLQIENDVKLERYVEKDKILEYFRNFTEHTKQTIVQELENLEGKITSPPEYREANSASIQVSRNSILGLIASFQDFK